MFFNIWRCFSVVTEQLTSLVEVIFSQKYGPMIIFDGKQHQKVIFGKCNAISLGRHLLICYLKFFSSSYLQLYSVKSEPRLS